ncbi:MAG: hypothetical protein J6J74_07345 [Elusimicrobiaceae bacterium]|nr:hypothetical protein [Elusimicrobiaceae bacterium]
MIDTEKITQGKFFYHKGISELVFDREATADVIGCSPENLRFLRKENFLKPMKARFKRALVFAQSDIENYLKQRD